MSRSAFCLGIDVNDLTKPILTEEQIERERNTHYMRDKTKIEWSVYDEETAPLLENTLRDIYEGKTNEQGRPERVSERMVYRIMNIPQHRLEIFPKCKEILNKYSETYEENWARKIIWAYNKLKINNKPFYWSDIRKLTGVKKKNIDKVIPYIIQKINTKTAEEIIEFLK